MFPKPRKDGMLHQNYMPITLLTSLNKMTEGIILSRLEEETETLAAEQIGFRHHHSTEQQVLRLVGYTSRELCEKKVTAYLFLDVAFAYDRLIFKNGQLG